MPRLAPLSAAVVLALACQTADAQVVPFKVKGGGPGPMGLSLAGEDSPHSATGNATHLGKYSGDQGIANVLTFDPATGGGTFQGSFVFVAANGDKLACTYGATDNGAGQVGEFQVFPAADGKVFVVFIAEFNPVPGLCTGKFKDVVDGSFLMIAMTEPFTPGVNAAGFTAPFNYTWEGDGWLKFRKGK